MTSGTNKPDPFKPSKSKPAFPQRPRHQIKRSITELSSPIRLPKQLNHHHHHHHHHHYHYHSRDHGSDELDPISASSMNQYSRASLDLSRSRGTTSPYPAVDHDQRINPLPPAPDNLSAVARTRSSQPRSGKDEQVVRERERMASTITGLRESLLDLGRFSTATTRRLDDSYYAVLEKLGMLQSTIGALKELADNSQELNEVFKAQSREVTTDVGSQLDAFGQFDHQQQRIEDLQGRIQAGREAVQALSERVGVVQIRIEAWERADKEWQERTRKRLKVIWLIMSSMLFIVALLFVSAKYAPGAIDASLGTDMASGKNDDRPPLSDLANNGSKDAEVMMDEVREELNKRRGDGPGEDALLRAFDEL